MKLWKKTILLMLLTLLISLGLVGGLTLYISYRNSMFNTAETYGKQNHAAARMLEQFWDSPKYEGMTEIGKRSYRNFQFRLCCGNGYALLDGDEVTENLTNYNIVDTSPLNMDDSPDSYDYAIQKIGKKYIMLQKTALTIPENFTVLSVQDITRVFTEIRKLAIWYIIIYVVIFIMAGFFIYKMMNLTVRAMENLQEVSEKQEMLLGALAHEMKTPLTSIIGYSDTLLHVKLEEAQKERALMHIHREGSRLEALSGKLLQMIGLYRNNAIHLEDHPVSELIRRTEDVETEKCMEKGICLKTEYEDFSLKIDMELMESLLINLVDNAIRASKPGNTVMIRAKHDKKHKILQVEDKGEGIPEDEIDKITEAFYMVDKSRSRKQGGAGLGLALCQQIADIHNAGLSIKSKVGCGTVVTVWF